jgi:oligoendopeptidase F
MIGGSIPDGLRERILDAMSDWESNTSIRFIERTNQSKYVNIVHLSASDKAAGYSTIGCASDPRILLKASTSYSTIFHELGHTIGLVHEHERADRDDHIIIRMK